MNCEKWNIQSPGNNDKPVLIENIFCDIDTEENLMIMSVPAETKPVKAAVFIANEDDIFLRINWNSWYKIQPGNDYKADSECRKAAVTFELPDNAERKKIIPVFHVKHIPEPVFSKHTLANLNKQMEKNEENCDRENDPGDCDCRDNREFLLQKEFILGEFQSENPQCCFKMSYDLHRMRILPSDDRNNDSDKLQNIANMISAKGVYSDFGMTGREYRDTPAAVRKNIAAAENLFRRIDCPFNGPVYQPGFEKSMMKAFDELERFWKNDNPAVLKGILTYAPMWTLIFEKRNLAILFHVLPAGDPVPEKEILFVLDERSRIKREMPEETNIAILFVANDEQISKFESWENKPFYLYFATPDFIRETIVMISMDENFI